MATAAVLATAILYVAAPWLPLPEFWRRLLAGAGEAGTVGGLADWFAVTALFRRPLGLPIPHTALIPARKDEIARSLARFVEEYFLDPAQLLARLAEADRAGELAAWLETEGASRFIAARLAAVLRQLVERGGHLDLVDRVIPLLRAVNDGLRRSLADEIGKRTGRFVPRFVDRRLAAAGTTVIDGVIAALGTPDSPERAAFDAWLRARFAEIPSDWRDAANLLIHEFDRELAAPARLAAPEFVDALAEMVRQGGRAVSASPEIRAWINGAIESAVIDYIAPWRRQIGGYVETVVRRWDAREVTRIIELQVGRDLQYVRLNGTVIGALIGVGLFVAAWAIGRG